MKKIALISAIALSGLFYNNANAQILQIGLNLGGHRPLIQASLATPNVAVSYSNADDYYYLPDVDAYYSVPEKVYYYNNGVEWVPAAYLPGEFRDYDWRAARHYEVRARRPFLNADAYRERYNGRAYDWRRYNDRAEVRRDDRFDRRDDRRDDRFNNRRDYNNNYRPQEPRFVRPNDQPRGMEHSDRNWNNNRGNDNRNDNRDHQNNNQPQRSNDDRSQQQHGNDHFVNNHGDAGHRGFGRF